MKKIIKIIFPLCFLSVVISCSHSVDNLDTLPKVDFTTQVLPIFQNNCAMSGCHNSSEDGEEFALDSYVSIMKHITPNSLSDSKAYQSMINAWGEIMPPDPKSPLSQQQRTTIAVWIQQGAKN